LFVLQSAAQAGSGCVSWALRGRCCCALAQSGAPDMHGTHGTQRNAPPACCAQPASTNDHESSGPAVRPDSGCCCKLAPMPVAPANGPAAESGEAQASARASPLDGFAQWIGSAALALALQPVPAAEPSPPDLPQSPPLDTVEIGCRRLVARGVIGFLSDLGSARL
jgi:hypothetical protein